MHFHGNQTSVTNLVASHWCTTSLARNINCKARENQKKELESVNEQVNSPKEQAKELQIRVIYEWKVVTCMCIYREYSKKQWMARISYDVGQTQIQGANKEVRKKRVRIWNTIIYANIVLAMTGDMQCMHICFLLKERVSSISCLDIDMFELCHCFGELLFYFLFLVYLLLFCGIFFFLISVAVHFNGCVLLTNKKLTKVVHVTVN